MVSKQDIGIPMGIDPAPLSPISKKSIRVHKFIDELWPINDDGKFSKSFKCIYAGELEIKLEHSGMHAKFVDLDIKIEDGIFVYRFFDKSGKFQFFIIHMPQFESNIPSNIFYGILRYFAKHILLC